MKRLNNFRLLLILLATALFSSCGYGVHRDIPVSTVSIGKIENRTYEHGLEDKLRVVLTEELMKNGIKVNDKSPNIISGTIDTFALRGGAQKSDITVQFEVFIQGTFSLIETGAASPGKKGSMTPLRGMVVFPVTFASEDRLEDIRAFKEEATERALRDLAGEIAASILFNK